PGCTSTTVTTTIPLTVTVRDTDGNGESGLPVYAFDGATYTGYHKTTNASGEATFTLPQGDYRFRADKNGTHFWSGEANHCTVPGCTSAAITVDSQALGTPAGGVASGYSLPDLSLMLLAPLAVLALGRRKRWQRWTTPVAGVLLVVAVVSSGTALADTPAVIPESGQMPQVRVSNPLEEQSSEAVTMPVNGLPLAPAPAAQPEPAPRAQSAGTITTRVITYTYDPLNRLTGAYYSTGESFEYAYDAVGNRTAMTETTALDETTVTTYTYDAANRLLISVSSGHPITYAWDARGNLVSDGTFTYAYNGAGRMVRAESVTATIVYTYNHSGLRVAQSVDGDATTFAWDWATGVPEMLRQGDNLYLVGHETLGEWDGATWAYHLPDALGSVRQAVDGAGAVTAAREWTLYGVEVGAAQPGLGYTGEWWDAQVGLQYLRARWYDAETGRFTRRDPWKGDTFRPVSLQSYLYANDNPLGYVDPTGAQSIETVLGWLRDKAEACYEAGDLDCVWNCYWALANGGSILGYRHASRHMFQFLYKKGDIVYPYRSTGGPEGENSGWIRRSPSVQGEIPKVEQRILRLIHTDARSGIRSGYVETSQFSVYPDRNTERDLYYAMNVFALWAETDYEIEGCYEVKVRPTYRFWDPYDWHEGLAAMGPVPGLAGFKDEWAAALHDAGLAEEYEISGYWLDPVKVYTFPSSWLALDVPPAPISVRPGRWSD
ncbi:MAG: RHS repeat domain-containing protein, partial [Anaerolineae bacterium]